MRRVLVTGATGAIGPAVVAKLLEAGLSVRAFVRSPGTPLDPRVEVARGDLVEQSTLDAACDGVDGIVHLAALLHRSRLEPQMEAAYQAVNAEGTSRLVSEAAKHGIRVVFASTIAVYGDNRAEPLHEDMVPMPSTIYGRTKLQAEQAVLHASTQDGRPIGTVLRLAAVYGPGVKGNYRQLVRALARHRFVPVGAGVNRRALVYVDDVASAVLLALTTAGAAGRLYNVADGHEHTLQAIVESICAALGRRPPTLAVPLVPVRLGVRALESVGAIVGWTPPVTTEMLDKYVDDVRVNSDRIRNELGFVAAVDLRTGWRQTVTAMRLAGELA